ncbi:flavin-containing monooxygenase [Occallatibacter riparius]|uniref:FAD-dependent oxidoreductase n=1 Tax=Occallatibacter riparius TaxID=1002689 RepID=A0A9J7BSF6_9BACT|nr:FAD-dependent oxidoreductase [Occallatibacter riparius]UWZ85513.1 FAD-dependent oxidoreductase [Occallatibacter riparius]
MKVCIIGAGPSGLATARRLLEAGIRDVVILERQSTVGGNWTWADASGHSSIYDTVRSISSRDMTAFEGVPFSSTVGIYPTRTDMLLYLQRFPARFDLERLIRFNTHVVSIVPSPEKGWRVETEGNPPEYFDAVCICSGHHWKPLYPDLPGKFSGNIVHAHEYRDCSRFAGQRVLVIGCGNSGADIAVDLARHGCQVFLSLRRGYHIVPRFLFGMPSDVLYSRLRRVLPDRVLRPLAELLLTAYRHYVVGDKLPEPNHPLFATHPLVNSELLPCIRKAGVQVVGPIGNVRGAEICFGSFPNQRRRCGAAQSEFDTIIACTGYEVSHPFLEDSITGGSTDALVERLHLRLVHKTMKGLYFVGLLQPSGSLWPVADAQAKFVAAHLTGEVQPPTIEPAASDCRDRFVPSPRHILEVNGEDYERALLALVSARGGALQ